jgi:carbonic anhydrase/acetyltransferase-like protein (isoleucine patch superfamily)
MPVYALDDVQPSLPAAGSFWIAPDAHVIGRVSLGAGVGIWFGAVLRGDRELIAVGENTNLQEGAVLHTDMGFPMSIGRDCTIGHGAIVHGCTLGDRVLVGMGATVMNGAVIGADSLIGAGAVVTERKSFPPRSLIVGAPAKLMRALDEEAVQRLGESAASYVENWRRFAAGLRRLD